MNKFLSAVVIPIYKDELTDAEAMSLKQCCKTLSKHPIIFVAPPEINFKVYNDICPSFYGVVHFKKRYFESIKGYNELMLSADFYKQFLNFKFILIYQLDAYVFKDELLYWCNKNYDFIGAPHTPYNDQNGGMHFLKKYGNVLLFLKNKLGIHHKISNVGNGGLSLRKTRSFYILLKILNRRAAKWVYNEDAFFEYWGNLLYPFFKLPTDETALEFSIEDSPKRSLEKLTYNLPFGCHAFEKYDFETWQPFIIEKNK